ncbi:MAG: hypothetical protein GX230_02750 [Lentisphaerae bacterium]|nr:hypothetical protein [Lentisphaerota bacterium]
MTLRRSEAIIRYTTEKPVPLALKTYDRTLYPGMPVVISPDEINAGSTGGITGGESIPIYTKHLNLVSGPGENTTPDTPEVTVAQPGDYTLELVVVNDAGNIATSKLCTVTVFVVYPPAVTNSGATAWGHSSAILHGEVLDIGGDTPITRFDYWLTGSDTTNTLSMGYQSGEFSAKLSGLMPNTSYTYQIVLSNAAAVIYSTTTDFNTHGSNATLYVSQSGTHTAGKDWATAYSNLPTVWEIAEPGDTILLAGQTFAGGAQNPAQADDAVFIWKNGKDVVLRGGYQASPALAPTGHPGPRDADLWPTVLTKTGGVARIFSFLSASNCIIDTVTITDGYYNIAPYRGAGAYLNNCRDVAFQNCRFIGNTVRAAVYSVTPSGSGLYLADSTVTLTDTLIIDNLTQAASPGGKEAHGGGVYVDGTSSLSVSNSRLKRNRTEGHSGIGRGGGFYVAVGGRLDIDAVIMCENSAWDNHSSNSGCGGAIANNGVMHLRSSLLYNNLTKNQYSDGIWSGGSATVSTIESSTIADNNNGVGILCESGMIALTNSIVWGHTTDLAGFPNNGSSLLTTVSHSLFATPEGMEWVNGCLSQDPHFVDPAIGNYRPATGRKTAPGPLSPAFEAGINLPWMTNARDLDGNRRAVNIVDIGAYEAPPAPGSVILLR